jgi:hypothetical protein
MREDCQRDSDYFKLLARMAANKNTSATNYAISAKFQQGLLAHSLLFSLLSAGILSLANASSSKFGERTSRRPPKGSANLLLQLQKLP